MPFPDRGNSQSDYLELPPPEEPVDWGEYQVHVARHAVHLVTEANGEKEYVVSNMKKFKVDIMLYNVKTGQLATAPLDIKSTLVYENAQPVRAAPDEQVLTGDTEVTVVNGQATIELMLGKRSLSLHHDRQRFRVKIEPADPQLAASYPTLTILNQPLKSVTKLHRTPAPSRAAPRTAPHPTPGGATSTATPNYANGLGMPGGPPLPRPGGPSTLPRPSQTRPAANGAPPSARPTPATAVPAGGGRAGASAGGVAAREAA